MIHLNLYQKVFEMEVEDELLKTPEGVSEFSAYSIILKNAEEAYQSIATETLLTSRAKLDLLIKLKEVAEKVDSHFEKLINGISEEDLKNKQLNFKFIEKINSEIDKVDKLATKLWLPERFTESTMNLQKKLHEESKFYPNSYVARIYFQFLVSQSEDRANFLLPLAYAQLVGSKSLKCSLEGTSAHISVLFFCNNLKEFFEVFKNQFLEEDLKNFENIHYCLQHTLEFESEVGMLHYFFDSLMKKESLTNDDLSNFQHKISDVAHGLRLKIFLLKEMVFVGGIVNGFNCANHGCTVSVKREMNDKFTFSLIDTASGCELIFDNIEPEILLNDKFLIDIIKVNIKNPDNSQEKFLDILVKHLFNGKNYKRGRKIKRQTNGTCGYDCILRWLEGSMSPSTFKAFEVFITGSYLHRLKRFRRGDPMEEYVSTITTKNSFWPLKDISLIEEIKRLGLLTFQEKSEEFKETIYCLPGTHPYRMRLNTFPTLVKEHFQLTELE